MHAMTDPSDTSATLRPRGRPRLENNEQFERRRAEIVDIAAKVFAEHGFHATTVDNLVEATGLQRGGLYHYMESKEDLLIRIHERFIEPLLVDASKVADANDPPEVALRNLGHVLMQDIAGYLPQVTVFLHEWRIIEHDERWHSIRKARKEFEQTISAVLQRGVDEGVFEIKDVRLTTLGFLGMFNYSYQWYKPAGRRSAAQIADRFCDIFLGGITR
jgi:AcrR family transcriptional regulator